MIKNVKIMVVEQDSMIKNFIVDVLEFSVNRKVHCFENGIDALDYIENNGNVDIIICAKDVPGISGIDLLTTIKKNGQAPSVSGYPIYLVVIKPQSIRS